MQMASEQKPNYGLFPQSFCNQNVVSFQAGMVNSTSMGMVPVTANESIEASSRVGGLLGTLNASCSMASPMNSNMIGTSSMIASSDMSSSPGLVVDQSHLKYGSPISVEWSQQELAILRDGLARHANEQSIMKYVKIAARLPEKTVRDVAMRCQWMMRKESAKRRKAEEYFAGRKMKDKDVAVESTLWARNYPGNMPSQSCIQNNTTYTNQVSCGESGIESARRQVLEENNRLLDQIANNIATSQTQSNIELFNRTRRNLNIVLNSMIQMPGAMRNMPPMPISPNERLADYIILNVNMANPTRINQVNAQPQGW